MFHLIEQHNDVTKFCASSELQNNNCKHHENKSAFLEAKETKTQQTSDEEESVTTYDEAGR